jgi:hypothetical protein
MTDKKSREKRKRTKIIVPLDQKLALTVDEFCAAHNISRTFFYELRSAGKGPASMMVGGRHLISIEAAARWRATYTAASEVAA